MEYTADLGVFPWYRILFSCKFWLWLGVCYSWWKLITHGTSERPCKELFQLLKLLFNPTSFFSSRLFDPNPSKLPFAHCTLTKYCKALTVHVKHRCICCVCVVKYQDKLPVSILSSHAMSAQILGTPFLLTSPVNCCSPNLSYFPVISKLIFEMHL